MQETVLIYKVIPYFIFAVGMILGLTSGILIYTGLSSNTERIQTRLRVRQSYQKNKAKLADNASKSSTEDWLKKADYPLGLNGLKYHTIFFSIIFLLICNYVIVPLVFNGSSSIWAMLGVILVFILFHPSLPTLFVYLMKRVIDYKQAKKNAEIFMFYDLLINELEMMSVTRINAYNIIRNMRPYFDVIHSSISKLLTRWNNDDGPKVALDKFASEIGSKEAKALVSVMKTLDEVDRETAIESLKGMNNMFVRSQIENYRRRWKITTDLASIPIRTTHFLIILNFLVVIVVMVSYIMDNTRQ
ncbi:hypothetical protein ACFFIX_20560 [Metabacillus herbersteinensis]|uniref:Type II secretion system protein GspF domain-containing protein n=1 Tax=Metabacillus herbersteinensis TaxID=283816 RepID=A0ABV6GJB1_9BACI